MELEELKENLAMLAISDLEELGLSLADFEDDEVVKLYTTSDEYSQEQKEVTWVASINNEDHNLVTITNGFLHDEETAKELNRPAEISKIIIDENKAEMFIEALFHAYPELIHAAVEGTEGTLNSSVIDQAPEGKEINLPTDQAIGMLKKEIARLEKLKDSTDLDGDKAIDVFTKIKAFASQYKESKTEPEIVRRKNTMLFVSSFEKNKIIKLVEVNIGTIVREKTEDMPSTKITKTILIDKHLALPLYKALKKIFKKDG